MTGHFRVAPGELEGHESDLTRISGRMTEVTRAATPISSGAYGLIGQVFAVRTADTEARSVRAVHELAASVTADVGKLKDTRIAYLENELKLAKHLEQTHQSPPPAHLAPAKPAPAKHHPEKRPKKHGSRADRERHANGGIRDALKADRLRERLDRDERRIEELERKIDQMEEGHDRTAGR